MSGLSKSSLPEEYPPSAFERKPVGDCVGCASSSRNSSPSTFKRASTSSSSRSSSASSRSGSPRSTSPSASSRSASASSRSPSPSRALSANQASPYVSPAAAVVLASSASSRSPSSTSSPKSASTLRSSPAERAALTSQIRSASPREEINRVLNSAAARGSPSPLLSGGVMEDPQLQLIPLSPSTKSPQELAREDMARSASLSPRRSSPTSPRISLSSSASSRPSSKLETVVERNFSDDGQVAGVVVEVPASGQQKFYINKTPVSQAEYSETFPDAVSPSARPSGRSALGRTSVRSLGSNSEALLSPQELAELDLAKSAPLSPRSQASLLSRVRLPEETVAAFASPSTPPGSPGRTYPSSPRRSPSSSSSGRVLPTPRNSPATQEDDTWQIIQEITNPNTEDKGYVTRNDSGISKYFINGGQVTAAEYKAFNDLTLY